MLSPQIIELEQKLRNFSVEDKQWLLEQLHQQLGLNNQKTTKQALMDSWNEAYSDGLDESETLMLEGITTNLRRAKAIGNVLLNEGEGNLPESSVVNVSQVFTVDKRLLTESIGRLSREKIKLIIQGIKLVIEPQELE